jgi:hypothetical protein
VQHLITEYKIIEELSLEFFELYINKAIQEGWQPFGAVAVTTWEFDSRGDVDRSFLYTQAMVKQSNGERVHVYAPVKQPND